MPKNRFRHALVSVLLLVAMLCQGTWALAGTTGGLSGVVYEAGGTTPVANAQVTVSSPSQTTSTQSDATGHFSFVSLAPDTYNITVAKQGYDTGSQPGITVFADQTQTVSLAVHKTALKEIANVTSRATNELVRSGTTSDVYSVSATAAEKAGTLGGGGNLNNAYSAVSAVPGAYVPQGMQGYGQAIFIRGGDFDQVGYEYDGVPVNRSFDQYAGGSLSNLGQQELQVYTGGAPAGSSAAAISGFINQVIRTGTYPGFGTVNLGLGAPIFYHKASGEAGGATPNRLFSYYVGVAGYNQAFRLWDQQNGGAPNPSTGFLSVLNSPYNTSLNGVPTGVVPMCDGAALTQTQLNGVPVTSYAGGGLPAGMSSDPGCFAFGPGTIGNGNGVQADAGGAGFSDIADREGVANIHIGIPHHHDAGRDDVQILASSSSLFSKVYGSQNDIGLTGAFNAFGGPAGNPQCYSAVTGAFNYGACNSTLSYLEPPIFQNAKFGMPAAGQVAKPYFQPSSALNRNPGALIDPNARDGFTNDQAIVKLQYQRNLSASSYLRLYGYTFYSDWLINGPNNNGINFSEAFNAQTGNIGAEIGQSPDYELSTHTRGVELQYANQINAQNLVNFTANYTTAQTLRVNNTTLFDLAGSSARATNDTDGTFCYTATGAQGTCNRPPAGSPTTQGTFTNPMPFAPVNGTWIITNPGIRATANAVVPKFSSLALSDQWKPNDKLLVNAGVRLERFEFDLANTSGNGREFWFPAAQREYCYDTTNLQPILTSGRPFATLGSCAAATGNPNAVHPDGVGGHRLLTNNYGPTIVNQIFSPRLAATYTVNPDTVLRFSYGKYAQPISSAFVQYNQLQPNLPSFLFTTFWKYGFTSPRHDVVPAISDNFDGSLEKRIHGSDVSFKLSPFYRSTKDQAQQFYLDPTTGFVSGLNVGHQTSYGLEFQLQKGDFNRNGLSGVVSYTYTHSRIKYNDFRGAPGRNVIDVLNDSIIGYNKFTSHCVGAGGVGTIAADTKACGSAPSVAAPCYTAGAGAPEACAGDPAAIANPYYNDAAQPLFDRNASYYPFDVFPGVAQYLGLPGAGTNSFAVPHVFTAILNWRHDRLAITPSVQYNVGNPYGVPLDTPGIDPTTCGNNQAGVPTGAAAPFGTLTADYSSCAGQISVPNPENGGRFTQLGQYRNPSQLSLNAAITYDMSKQVRANLTLANLYNRCSGGDSTPWRSAFSDTRVCAFGSNGFAPSPIAPHGGFFNGSSPNDAAANGVALNPYLAHTYQPASFTQPFNAYFNITIKL